MRIKHIYITKEGEPMANPEMEYPTEPIEDDDGELILNDSCPNCGATYDEIDAEYQICHLCKFDSSHEAMLAKYHSGLLPFENENIWIMLRATFAYPSIHSNPKDIISEAKKLFKPDTLIPVDLEVEVVNQRNMRTKTGRKDKWIDWDDHEYRIRTSDIYEYRTVLRIKP